MWRGRWQKVSFVLKYRCLAPKSDKTNDGNPSGGGPIISGVILSYQSLHEDGATVTMLHVGDLVSQQQLPKAKVGDSLTDLLSAAGGFHGCHYYDPLHRSNSDTRQ